MAIVSDVEIRLRADIARLQGDMDAARRSVGGAMSGIASSVKIATTALAAFAAAAVVGAIISFVKGIKDMVGGIIEAAGSLNDLSIQTGASVAALMQFKTIGATSDTTVETLAGAMNKLAKGFSSTTEESKGLPQALKAIGLEFGAIRKLSPEQQTLAIAKALDNFADGSGKAAVAMAFYGKEGAKLLPFLKDLADEHDKVTAALTEQEIASKKALAAMADNFGDNLAKIQQASAETRKSFTYGILPALNEMSEAWLAVIKGGNGTKETIDKLSQDGSLADWARKAFTALSYIPDILEVVFRVAKTTFGLIKTVVVQTAEALMGAGKAAVQFIEGDYKKSWETIGETTKAVRATATADALAISAAWNAPTTGAKLREQMKLAQEAKVAAAEAAKPQAEFTAEDPKEAARVAKELSAYAALIASIKSKTAENKLELEVGQQASESQKIQIKIEQELASGKLKLTDAHAAAARAALVELAASEELIKSQKAQTEVTKFIVESTAARDAQNAALNVEYQAYGKSADAREIYMATVNAQTATQKKLSDLELAHLPISEQIINQLKAEEKARILVGEATLGQTKALRYAAQLADENKKFSAEAIIDEKARNAALLEIDADVWRERIKLAGEGTEAQKLLKTEFDTWYANQLSKPELEAQKEFWKSIDKTAHDTFVSIADGGKAAWQRLKDSAKNVFFDWLYQMTIKKWLINISTTTDGQGIASALSAASSSSGSGGMGGVGNLISIGKSIYQGFSGGFASLSTTIADTVQAGLYQTGLSSNLLSNGAFANGVGAVGSAAAGIAGGIYGGRLVSGGYGGNSAVNTGTAIGAVVGSIVPVIGTALGALVGGLLGGLHNRLFGYKAAEVSSEGIRGTFADDTVYGQSFQNILQKGGLFRSDKRHAETQNFTAEIQSQLGDGFKTLKSAASAAGVSLGLAGDALAGYRKTFELTLGKDAAANEKVITDFFTAMSDEMANRLVPNLAQFAQKGESAAATLERLAANAQGVDAVLAAFGSNTAQAFGATGVAAIEARERLVALSGGLQSLGTQAQYFADNFLSKAEQVAPAQKQLTEVLGQLGYANVKTTDQYRDAVLALVKSGALATESGAKTYASLLALAPAFKTLTDYANELKSAAAEAANTALDALGRAVDAQKNVVIAAYDKAMAVLDERITSLNATISTTTALSNALKGAMAGVDAPGSGQASRAVAAAQIQTALAIAKASGSLPSVDSLADALATLKGDSADQFGSLADYQRSVAQTNAALEALGGLTDTQLSAAEQQLAATIAQKDQLASHNEAELARLDNLVLAAKAQIDAVNGMNTTSLNLYQALIGVYNAAQVLSGYTGISATSVAPTGSPSATIDTNALLAELQTLNARIARMEEHAAQTAGNTGQFAKQFNDVSAGGNALLTETA